MRCPRPWRARNATLRPSSVPRTYASEGLPNGVLRRTSLTLVRPGIEYSPLPPMIPISACAKGLLGVTSDKVVIIQKEVLLALWDRVSDPVPHDQKLFGSNHSEDFLLQAVGGRLVQALSDQHGVALHINDDWSVLSQPGPLAGQMIQYIGLNRRFLAVFQHIIHMLVSLAQSGGIDRGKICGLFRTGPARGV